ncbi:MAG: carboxypeptidase-like regulatory domain-containing protein, partial [Flavobacteriales bacterium]|nr:carboxypeptidase-like regulatory domain-containing protein [Flavobacteriales bacterium]
MSGRVVDADNGETMPFVNIHFKNSKIGTTTDLDGRYRIETYYATDSLVASFIGYNFQVKSVNKDVSQTVNFELTISSVELKTAEVVATDEENPAHPVVRNVLKNKKINNREKLDAYEYELYNKVEFDLNNITDEFRERRIFKPFEFVFDNLDSTEEKIYLPVFMTESLSNFYFRRNPKTEKEVITATKVSGIENNSVSQFLGDMYQSVNIYDNNVIVFGKSFVSPISNLGFGFYNYYLMDSAYIDNKWCYMIKFTPKRKQELTFDGEMWVNDTTYAVKKVTGTIADDANINFIYGLSVQQEFDEVEPEVWMLSQEELVVDFNVTDKTMGFYGRKTTTYKDFVINKPRSDDFYRGLSDVIVADDANEKPPEFWDDARHIKLTENEQAVYSMVDTIQNVPQFRTVVDIITLFVSGYKVMGNFELGPYYTLYSFNPIEGNRFRLGGRTSNAFSTRLMLEGYTAYGLRDEKFKYGGGVTYMMSKNPRMVIYAGGKKDIEQLGQAEGAFREDNVLSSIFRRNPASKLTAVTETKTYLEREWFYGLSNRLMFTHRVLRPLGDLRYERYNDADNLVPVSSLTTSEVTLYTRFAYKEKFVSGEFERISLGTKYPTLEVAYSVGIPDVWGSDYEYQKALIRVKDKVLFGPLGYMKVRLEAGKIWGKLPFPLLQLHQGNETFFYD